MLFEIRPILLHTWQALRKHAITARAQRSCIILTMTCVRIELHRLSVFNRFTECNRGHTRRPIYVINQIDVSRQIGKK